MHEPALRIGFTGIAVHMVMAGTAQADKVVKAESYGLISCAPHLARLAVMHVRGVQPAPLAFPLVSAIRSFFR